jgi:hypothetical protein
MVSRSERAKILEDLKFSEARGRVSKEDAYKIRLDLGAVRSQRGYIYSDLRNKGFSVEQSAQISKDPSKYIIESKSSVVTDDGIKATQTNVVPSSLSSESPYSRTYIPPEQQRSYLIPEERKIQTFRNEQGRIVGIQDPNARMSYAARQGEEFSAQEIQVIESKREQQLQDTRISDMLKPKEKEKQPRIPSEYLISPKLSLSEQIGKQVDIAEQKRNYPIAITGAAVRVPIEFIESIPKKVSKGVTQTGLEIEALRTGKRLQSDYTFSSQNPIDIYTGVFQGLRERPGETIGKGIGMYFTGKAITGATELKLTGEDIATLRTTTASGEVYDVSDINIGVKSGGQTYTIKGKGVQEYRPISENQFISKGSIELKSGKLNLNEKIDIRGSAIAKEGGYDVTSLIKTKKGKYLDVTQTAETISAPMEEFRSISRTSKVQNELYNFKPTSVSAGVTRELYVEDIFSGKNIFKKDIVSESGQVIGSKSILTSSNIEINQPSFLGTRKTIDYPKVQVFDSSVSTGGNMLTGRVVSQTKSIPAITQTVAKNQVLDSIDKLNLNTKLQTSFMLGTGISTQKTYPQSILEPQKQSSKMEQAPIAISKMMQSQKSNISLEQVFDSNQKQETFSIQKTRSATMQPQKQILTSIVSSDQILSQESMTKPMLKFEQISSQAQRVESKPAMSYKPILQSPRSIIPTRPMTSTKVIPFFSPGSISLTGQSSYYNVFALNNATKKANYIKINQQPLPREKALSLGSNAVDQTVSARFKIVPTTVDNRDIPKINEYAQTIDLPNKVPTKFQDFKVVKGQQIKMNDIFIEKTGNRIDSRGEHEGITVMGWVAKRNKISTKSRKQKINLFAM